MRLDQLLVKLNLAPSRAKAQELIRSGEVEVLQTRKQTSPRGAHALPIEGCWEAVTLVSYPVDESLGLEGVRLRSQESLRYASRAGLKLKGALEELKLDPLGLNVLDVGQSTGGFTDCLLQEGAAGVVGVDVGKGQLAEKLKNDLRVVSFEGLHAKDLSQQKEFLRECPSEGFALVVVDVSFISLEKILPWLSPLVKEPGGHLLALVKPQFEVGADKLSKKGLVKDDGLYSLVEVNIKMALEVLAFQVKAYFPSPILGQEGNREFFIYAEKLGGKQRD